MPKLKGLTLDEARMALVSASLITGGLNHDATTAEGDSLCFVYRQEPVDGNIVPSGTKIDLWLTADTLLLKQTPQPATYTNSQDEEFFRGKRRKEKGERQKYKGESVTEKPRPTALGFGGATPTERGEVKNGKPRPGLFSVGHRPRRNHPIPEVPI